MHPQYRVLLIEDDHLIAKSLKMSLPYKGFEVSVCETSREGLASFSAGAFDLVLLDINLPDGDGFALCREMRKTNATIPILMLTAKTDVASAVAGIESGADDYVRKPYGVTELVARMKRMLERSGGLSAVPLRFGPIRVDPQKRLVWAGDKPLALGKREFEILALLVRKAGSAVTRTEILDALGEEADIYDRTIDSHLSHLRRKLRDAGVTGILITPIYGVGYRLELAGPAK